MLKIQTLQAAHGDCYILHYGDAASRHFILIDGGPPDIYSNHLKKALSPIRSQG